MRGFGLGACYPTKVQNIAIATTYAHSPQNVTFHEVLRQTIMSGLDWLDGSYLAQKFQRSGLTLARMTAHDYLSFRKCFAKKFGRDLKNKRRFAFKF